MDKKMLAESADLLLSHIVVAIRIEQHVKILAHHMGLANTSRVMAVGRARLTGSVVRASAHHLLIATALFPASFQTQPPYVKRSGKAPLRNKLNIFYRATPERAFLCRNDLRDALNPILEDTLNSISERHLRHRAALASSLKLNGHNAVFAHIDKLDIAAIGLKARTDELHNLCYLFLIYHFLLRSDR